jgi:hypothetical protein
MYYIKIISHIINIIGYLIISENVERVVNNDFFIYDTLRFGINK